MRIPWWLLFVVALAGCTTSSPGDPGGSIGGDALATGGSSGGPSGSLGPMPPAWSVGDHWTYDLGGQTATWIVTKDAGEDWVLDTDDTGLAFHHAAFGEVSTLGNVSKDLSGSQGADRVRFLDWPLQDGREWDLRWDGEDFRATLHDMGDGRWHVQASQDGTVRREYVYDESVGWFRFLRALDENGTLEWEATLVGSGHGYTGEYVRWDVHGVLDVRMDGTGSQGLMIGVPPNATDVWYGLELWCDPGGEEGAQGAVSLVLVPNKDPSRAFVHEDTCPDPAHLQGSLDATAGSWMGTLDSAGVSARGAFIPRTLRVFTL